jgi:hypothetical protein
MQSVVSDCVQRQGLASLLLCMLQETVFQAQAAQLAAAVPGLFAPGCCVRLATENGRSLLAKAGFTASRWGQWGRRGADADAHRVHYALRVQRGGSSGARVGCFDGSSEALGCCWCFNVSHKLVCWHSVPSSAVLHNIFLSARRRGACEGMWKSEHVLRGTPNADGRPAKHTCRVAAMTYADCNDCWCAALLQGRVHQVEWRATHSSDTRWCRSVHARLLLARDLGPTCIFMQQQWISQRKPGGG